MQLSEVLKRGRAKSGLTQKEAAALIGITREHYALIEEGHKFPSQYLLQKIAEEFNVRIDFVSVGG